jgi:hypothetical protein
MYLCTGFSQNTYAKDTSGYIVNKLQVTEGSVSHETKKTHHHNGCGWLAPKKGSKYTKKHIDPKDVVGLLLGEVVTTKKTHCCKECGWLTSRRW